MGREKATGAAALALPFQRKSPPPPSRSPHTLPGPSGAPGSLTALAGSQIPAETTGGCSTTPADTPTFQLWLTRQSTPMPALAAGPPRTSLHEEFLDGDTPPQPTPR